MLSDSTRNATVIAASDCQLLALGVGEFRQLIDRHPEIRAHFERVAAERMMPGGIGSRPPAVN
ncbi:MAG: cyclic nucleotide-binding domain-containing protein [Rhodospirillales bacterium]|nr:cyclic nucleotide-binding domain-containing protein [Rhodospirillales bacterium]